MWPLLCADFASEYQLSLIDGSLSFVEFRLYLAGLFAMPIEAHKGGHLTGGSRIGRHFTHVRGDEE